jgi:hypothetical protein
VVGHRPLDGTGYSIGAAHPAQISYWYGHKSVP